MVSVLSGLEVNLTHWARRGLRGRGLGLFPMVIPTADYMQSDLPEILGENSEGTDPEWREKRRENVTGEKWIPTVFPSSPQPSSHSLSASCALAQLPCLRCLFFLPLSGIKSSEAQFIHPSQLGVLCLGNPTTDLLLPAILLHAFGSGPHFLVLMKFHTRLSFSHQILYFPKAGNHVIFILYAFPLHLHTDVPSNTEVPGKYLLND